MHRPLAKKIAVTPARARARPFARAASIVGDRLIRGSLQHSAPGGGNQGLPALRAFARASRRADRVWGLFAEAATRRPVTGGRAFAHSGKFASKSWPP